MCLYSWKKKKKTEPEKIQRNFCPFADADVIKIAFYTSCLCTTVGRREEEARTQ